MSDVSQDSHLLAEISAPDERLVVRQPSTPKRMPSHMHERKWSKSISIRTYDGKKFKVPVTVDSAQAQRQLLAAKTQAVFEQNLNFIIDSKIPIDPKSMKDIAQTANTISEMVAAAYKNTPPPEATSGMSAIGQLAGQMLGAAAKGMMEGAAKMTAEERLKKISELGKKQREAIIVNGEKMEKLAEKTRDENRTD